MKVMRYWIEYGLPCLVMPGLVLTAAPLRADEVSSEAEDSAVAQESGSHGEAQGARSSRGLAGRELSDELIYSVSRSPERLFDTPRSAEVITKEEIQRKNARTLSDVLVEELGFYLFQGNYGAGVPIVRGFLGKQVQILIDGIKLNNSVWRGTGLQYLNLIDLSMVERIEIVRGVVSVLGTESLGGAINIITEKGPPGSQRLGGVIASRYSTADEASNNSLQVLGQGDRYRFIGGASFNDYGELEGGDGVGTLSPIAFEESGAHLRLDYFASPDRTVSFGYRRFRQREVPRFDQIFDGENLTNFYDPVELELGHVSYEDLTDRGFLTSLKVTAYWNQQTLGENWVSVDFPERESLTDDVQDQLGLSLELGSYAGGHQLVYGVDFTSEDIDSKAFDLDLATGTAAAVRSRFTDGASYETAGIYFLDAVDLTKWLTLQAGARFGYFSASGSEDSSVGRLTLDSEDTDVTGSLSLVFHLTPSLNLVGNVMRGFRAPNIDEISTFNTRKDGTEVPNPNISSERILTYEGGLKYRSSTFELSAFVHHSDLTDLLNRQPGIYRGLPFFDLDGDAVQDPNEPAVLLRQNVGEATIEGFEIRARYLPHRNVVLRGHYAEVTGEDEIEGEPLRRIPPGTGVLGARLFGHSKHRPWLELVYHFAQSQTRLAGGDVKDSRIGPGGTPAFEVFHLRSGLSLMDRFDLHLGVENIFDEAYHFHGSAVQRPGRQLVLGAQYRF